MIINYLFWNSDTYEDIANSRMQVLSGGKIDAIYESKNPHLMKIASSYSSYESLDEVLKNIPLRKNILVGSHGYFEYILRKTYFDRRLV